MASWGVHRKALAAAVKRADWLDVRGTDAAALQVARELADRLDAMRRDRTLFGDARTNWHSANVAAKYLDALRELRLTNQTRPDTDDETSGIADAVAQLIAVPDDSGA